jgi:hypothetical protein
VSESIGREDVSRDSSSMETDMVAREDRGLHPTSGPLGQVDGFSFGNENNMMIWALPSPHFLVEERIHHF